jgi:hypothetical protein
MAKRITIGWEQYRIVRIKQNKDLFNIEARPVLLKCIPFSSWSSFYVGSLQACFDVLKSLQRLHYQKVKKPNVIEIDIPMNEIYS